jgi:hypothetical protein
MPPALKIASKVAPSMEASVLSRALLLLLARKSKNLSREIVKR